MLNNCMDELTRTQQQLTKTNDAQTTAWLRDNGMTEKQFQDWGCQIFCVNGVRLLLRHSFLKLNTKLI